MPGASRSEAWDRWTSFGPEEHWLQRLLRQLRQQGRQLLCIRSSPRTQPAAVATSQVPSPERAKVAVQPPTPPVSPARTSTASAPSPPKPVEQAQPAPVPQSSSRIPGPRLSATSVKVEGRLKPAVPASVAQQRSRRRSSHGRLRRLKSRLEPNPQSVDAKR